LVASGELCRGCAAGCRANLDQYEIECPVCNGSGCVECNHGKWRIPECPNEIAKSLGNFFELATLLDKGLPPMPGGALNQPAWFIRAYTRYKSELAEIQNERISRFNLDSQ
jgi:hypothetical protein